MKRLAAKAFRPNTDIISLQKKQKKSMNKTYLLLALFLSACSSSNATSFAIEDEFTEREVELIHEAADEWVEATDSEDAALFFRDDLSQDGEFDADKHWYEGDDYGYLWKIYSTEHGYHQLKDREKSDGYRGMAYDGKRILVVADKIDSDEEFKLIILHEFGHTFGISHLPSGLMSKGVGRRPCIDKVTLKEFCNINSCGQDAHVTCE